MGYSAVSVAAIIFYLDYIKKVDFHDIKLITTVAVIVYFFLNGVLQLWLWLGDNGEVFLGARGEEGHEQRLRICSLPPPRKYEPIYHIVIYTGTFENMGNEKEVSTPLTNFFTSDGYFVHSEFEKFLRREIPLLDSTGDSDKALSGPNHNALQPLQDEDVGETIVVKGKTEESDGTTDTPRKRGRPRKSHA